MNNARTRLLTLLIATGLILLLGVPLSAKNKKAKAASASIRAGEAVFKKNCNMCHFPDKADPKMGPGLKGLFKKQELPASHKPVSEAAVREQIEKGSPNAKPMPMPGFADKITPADLDALMAYLKTL